MESPSKTKICHSENICPQMIKDEDESFHPFSFKRMRRNELVFGLFALPKHLFEKKRLYARGWHVVRS